ncbi:uncharacterized protein LOC129582265 isoform X3 [Paramacrobiotus metropolitanus]|uniref:uncharacterized protein LOC129582265 isoform X3 n=1 Tax=Paramacrobiotus metropolitanus TaxID=2943436 RepID=UPI002445D0F7|nr:uncharacterized protein LOC129582265 isoform X3 [Paramacrobiotus metropolitanus]
MYHLAVVICLILAPRLSAYWDARDYLDEVEDDFLPDDWNSEAPLHELLSERSTINVLQDDIMYASAIYDSPAIYQANHAHASVVNDTQRERITFWSGGQVPYIISSAFGASSRFLIEDAMRRIEEATFGCISFVKRTVEDDFVSFQQGNNCSSILGMNRGSRGAGQPLFLRDDVNASCIVTGIVQHEILHALGMLHEHSRPDRDAYIEINHNAITEGHEANFRIKPEAKTYGIEYDLESIMHYGAFDFAKSLNVPIIVPRFAGFEMSMGQRKRLTVRDAAKLRSAYKCQVDSGKPVSTRQEPLRFVGTPLTPEECELQFNEHCGHFAIDRVGCRTSRMFFIICMLEADADFLWNMALAMAEYPSRAVGIVLAEPQITPEPFRPITEQVTALIMMACTVPQATSRLPSLGFINLNNFDMLDCRKMIVRKQDFAHFPQLRIIRFSNTTLVHLEKDTFTNLEQLRLIAWHVKIHEFPYFTADIQKFLNYLHCSCELAWLRHWWETRKIKIIKVSSNVSNAWLPYFNTDLLIAEVFLPIDCAADPFPSNLSMIDFTQVNFSINAPSRCQQNESNGVVDDAGILLPSRSILNSPASC